MPGSELETWTEDWRAIAGRIGKMLPGIWKWEPFGPDGLVLTNRTMSVIVTTSIEDGVWWVHASVARDDRLPSYHDLVAVHKAVWGADGFAYQVFASDARHVTIHQFALHLWGRSDGGNVLPDFGALGTI